MKLSKGDQFQDFIDLNEVFDDTKLRMTMIALADKIDETHRQIIYKTYNDPEIHSIYRGIRASGIYESGGKSKVHKKIVEFPNAYVFDFVDRTLSAIYGKDWLKKNKALNHELVRPWWVVRKI